jgi:hypothetical protein
VELPLVVRIARELKVFTRYGLRLWLRPMYSVRCEADVVMTSVILLPWRKSTYHRDFSLEMF